MESNNKEKTLTNNSLAIQQFKSGDIGFSASNTFLSKGIRFFTSLHTGKATASHAFALVGENLLVEALDHIRIKPIQKYGNPKQAVEVFRINISDEERKAFREGMIRLENGQYGWGKIVLFALDGITTGLKKMVGMKKPSFFFTQKLGVTSIPVCSQLVVYGLHKYTNYRVKDDDGKEINWRVASPDYLQDLLKLEHNGGKLIYKKAIGGSVLVSKVQAG